MMNSKIINKSSTLIISTIGAFLSFFIFGFVDNIKGPTISPLLQELGFNYSNIGTIFFGAYFGFFIAVIFSGLIGDIIGRKFLTILGGVLLFIGVISYSYSAVLLFLSLSMMIVGLGLGVIEVAANAFIVDLYSGSNKSGKYLLLLGFFHSLGAMLGPLMAGKLIQSGASWKSVYRISAIMIAVLIVYFLLINYKKPDTKKAKIDFDIIKTILFSKDMILFSVVILSYVGIEIGVASWIVEYLQKYKGWSISVSSIALSLFFFGIMFGRFFSSFIVEKIGYIKIMIYSISSAAVCLALGIFGPKEISFFIPLAGLFISIIFPTTTAAVSEISKDNIAIRLGMLFAFAGIGGMLGPWLLGVVSDRLGLNLGFPIILLSFSVIMLITLIIIQKFIYSSKPAELVD